LQLAIAGITVRGLPMVASISVWTVVLFLVYLGTLYLTYRYRGQPRWTPTKREDPPHDSKADNESSTDREDQTVRHSVSGLWLRFCGASLTVLLAGWPSRNRLMFLPSRPAWETPF
jgi:hypothetical protein